MELPQKWETAKTKRFKRRLLGWYAKNRRALPWRDLATPYRVWISEVMLQQTQVKTVIPYYERFIERFPDIESLANAQEQDVVRMWAGLGYYSRARNLHKAARSIMEKGGQFPRKFREILELPGVGRYTAGAISSIAFNEHQPVVDGNVKRVITRLKAIRKQPPAGHFWDQMSVWVQETKPSSFNQAMMELGATICVPAQPFCEQCPVERFCEARRIGIQDEIPGVRSKQPVQLTELVILVLESRGKTLLSTAHKMPYIPGKWSLPCRAILYRESPEQAASKLCQSILGETTRLAPIPRINHSITRYRIRAFGFHGKPDRLTESLALQSLRWVGTRKREEMLTSSLFRKILEKCQALRAPREKTGNRYRR